MDSKKLTPPQRKKDRINLTENTSKIAEDSIIARCGAVNDLANIRNRVDDIPTNEKGQKV